MRGTLIEDVFSSLFFSSSFFDVSIDTKHCAPTINPSDVVLSGIHVLTIACVDQLHVLTIACVDNYVLAIICVGNYMCWQLYVC